MNENSKNKVHWSFWAIGIFGLIWNVLGGVNFVMQTNADVVASFPETHRAIIEGRPLWATGGFALGVFGGAIASLMLLMRKSAATYIFIASLIGILVTSYHTLNIATSVIDFSAGEIVIMLVMPIVVAAFLLWYSRRV